MFRVKFPLKIQHLKNFWQRNMEESVRQGNMQPFIEEVVQQVSNWGFDIE